MSIEATPLIPRATLFGNPEKANASISPDGRYLSWSAPVDGVMNLWIAPRERPQDSRPLTHDRGRGITSGTWSYDGRHMLYQQDGNGDENYHLYALDVVTGEVRDLTPFPGARGLLLATSRRLRNDVLVSLNRRDPRFADLYRIRIATGEAELVQENPGFAGFIADEHFIVRGAVQPQRDGGSVYFKRASGGAWTPWLTLQPDDARSGGASHLSADGRTLYFFDTRNRDTAALVAFDFGSDAEGQTPRLIAEHAKADIGGALTDAETFEPVAYSATYEKHEFHVVDESVRADVEFLNARLKGEWRFADRSEDDQLWIVVASSDLMPHSSYLYDRRGRSLQLLFDSVPALADVPLARMQPTVIAARDGLPMVSYLTLPRHADAPGSVLGSTEPVPLVLLIHGGPWVRDHFGFNPTHQWLANRGYAVLSVNYRASTGFGKGFIAAGDREWGGKMSDDLRDAVKWAVDRGIADPARVCVMGGSYGGYATLWEMTDLPEAYACGVDIVGPSNLQTLLEAIPPQWEAGRATLYRAVGNPETEAGTALLQERSPLRKAGAIRRPLLIGQGANDPRVKQQEADQMVEAMQANRVPVTYVLYPDEGHGFARPQNRVHFNALTERFLAQHLGGRFEAMQPAETAGNTAILVVDTDGNGTL